MNTKLSTLVVTALFAAVAGCSATGTYDAPDPDGAGQAGDNATKSTAMSLAQQEVDDLAPLSDKDSWTETSVVSDAFPVYLEGVEGVSYYECKVETDGADAGYVLVNVNATDIPIVESATEGLTLHERYRDATKADGLKVFRYSWFASMAATDEGDVVAAIGFDPSGQLVRMDDDATRTRVDKLRSQFRAVVAEKGSHPLYTRDALTTAKLPVADQACPEGKCAQDRFVTAELTHSFDSGWHLPSWSQPTYSNGNAIGCANTAWAMLYAYWSQFKGKNGLFGGLDLSNNYQNSHSDDPAIYNAMAALSQHTDTHWVNDQGMVFPSDMCGGKYYAREHGYTHTTCVRDQGTEFSKIDEAIEELKADRPTMLLVHADGTGFANHYVAIEAARKRQRLIDGEWEDRDASYLANFGHGSVRKWIYTREVGPDAHDHYSSFSAFYVNVK
jgi:hypothetical protein